jgi:RNA polymerase sigma factor (sigma-70 family)
MQIQAIEKSDFGEKKGASRPEGSATARSFGHAALRITGGTSTDSRRTANTGAPTFEQSILPHLDAAYNLARWLARDAVLAEEIVQDACLRALQYFGSFRGENSRAWLLQIVRNVAYSTLRTVSANVSYTCIGAGQDDEDETVDIVNPNPGPERTLATAQGIEAALAALPMNLRECVILREMEDLSYKQISRILGVPIGTVMSRLFRARHLLMAERIATSGQRVD